VDGKGVGRGKGVQASGKLGVWGKFKKKKKKKKEIQQ
jgi:hypothetical protein